MRSKVAQKILAETPVEVKEMVNVYANELIKLDKSLGVHYIFSQGGK